MQERESTYFEQERLAVHTEAKPAPTPLFEGRNRKERREHGERSQMTGLAWLKPVRSKVKR